MNTLSLYRMTKNFEESFMALIDTDDLPEDALNDTLQALEGELNLKGANVAAFVLNCEAEAAKIKYVEEAIAKRRKSYENMAKRMRDYLRVNLEAAGIKKIEAIDKTFTVTLTAARASLIIDDENKIPVDFVSERVVKDIDKAAIKKSLEGGSVFEGAAHLEFKSGLRIA